MRRCAEPQATAQARSDALLAPSDVGGPRGGLGRVVPASSGESTGGSPHTPAWQGYGGGCIRTSYWAMVVDTRALYSR